MCAEIADDPIIVYGAPRSGTTYLQQVLNSHPDVFITHETRVFAWLHHALCLMEDDRYVLTHRDEFTEHLRKVLPQAIRDVYRELAPEARYWGDKNPHYADPFNKDGLDTIAELFPGTRFIHIMRDGRDVVSSLLRKRDEGKPWVTFEGAHETWKWHVHYGHMFGQGLPEDRYLEVRYENLVSDDLAVAARIFAFLGIELHPEVKAFCRRQREKRTPFKEPTRDLEKGVAVSDWAEIFTPEEQARSLELIGQDLTWYRYETEASLAQLRERTAAALASPHSIDG